MGRRLGNALIIYGIVNFFVWCFAGPVFGFAAFIWMWIFIAIGRWQRNKAARTEYNERMFDLAKRGANAEFEDKINRILDQRERDQKWR